MAIPAIIQQLGKNQMAQAAGPIKQMMNMIRSAKDPTAALNLLAARNPQLKQAMEIVQQYGGDSMAALRGEAAKMGVDPDEIMGMLK